MERFSLLSFAFILVLNGLEISLMILQVLTQFFKT